MKKSSFSRLAAVVLTLALIGVTAAVAADWVVLGERVVNDRVESDTIVVTGVEGEFTALKVKVFVRPVHFIDMKVHFANGGVQDVELRTVIPAGGETRVIDLAGDDRVVERVDFRYEAQSVGRGKRATIRLLGRH